MSREWRIGNRNQCQPSSPSVTPTVTQRALGPTFHVGIIINPFIALDAIQSNANRQQICLRWTKLAVFSNTMRLSNLTSFRLVPLVWDWVDYGQRRLTRVLEIFYLSRKLTIIHSKNINTGLWTCTGPVPFPHRKVIKSMDHLRKTSLHEGYYKWNAFPIIFPSVRGGLFNFLY